MMINSTSMNPVSLIRFLIKIRGAVMTKTHQFNDNLIEIEIANDDLSSVDSPFVSKDLKNNISKDQSINDNFTENLSDHPSSLDSLFVANDPKHNIGEDQLVATSADSIENVTNDPSKFDDLTAGEDPKDRNKNVDASSVKRKSGMIHRELEKLQDSLSKNEIITNVKRRCAK